MNTSSRSILLPVLTGVLALAGASAAQAQEERGRVLSSTPVMQQVAVPQQVCQNVSVREPARGSGAGAVMGAIAGGAMGNAVGHGNGRAAATALGIFGGAILGDRIEGRGQDTVRTVQECSTQSVVENRTVAYNVVYEYAGRQYSVQMANDPGRWVPVSVQPVGVAPAPAGYYRPQAAAPDVVRIGGYRPYGHDRYRDDRRWDDRDEGHWDRNWR
ncbi:glycine zipper 2TM domain-containing protein [Hydrogenophaga sp. RWCD_12]|uniref:glycine zipper 2TM domain-containing protein n=1 Tax=Hydrogenophaga sp. RWCD_12 TaxID=3391190 RepID=UPI00398487B6